MCVRLESGKTTEGIRPSAEERPGKPRLELIAGSPWMLRLKWRRLCMLFIGFFIDCSAWNVPKCRDHFVSGYFDMGVWRHTRQEYVEGITRTALYLTGRGCNFTLYCLGDKDEPGYDCSDFSAQIPTDNALFRVQQYSLNDAMRELRGFGIERTRQELRLALESMSIYRHPGSESDLLKYPLNTMQWYLMINHAKFSILHHAASHVDGSCSSGSCLVWVDAWIRDFLWMMSGDLN